MPNWLSTSATDANKLSGASTDTFAALTSTTVNAAAGVTTAGLNAGSNFIKANIPTNTTQTIINSQLNGLATSTGSIQGLISNLLSSGQVDAVKSGGFNYLQESGALKLDNILGELAAGSPAGDLGGLINDNIDLGVFGGLTQQETTDIMNSINSSISAIKSSMAVERSLRCSNKIVSFS